MFVNLIIARYSSLLTTDYIGFSVINNNMTRCADRSVVLQRGPEHLARCGVDRSPINPPAP